MRNEIVVGRLIGRACVCRMTTALSVSVFGWTARNHAFTRRLG